MRSQIKKYSCALWLVSFAMHFCINKVFPIGITYIKNTEVQFTGEFKKNHKKLSKILAGGIATGALWWELDLLKKYYLFGDGEETKRDQFTGDKTIQLIRSLFHVVLGSFEVTRNASYTGYHIDAGLVAKMLGFFLIIYATFIMLKPKTQLKQRPKTSITGGISSGFFAGIIGLGGAIRSAFLSAYNLKSTSYLFATNAISLLIDTARLPVYMCNGTTLDFIFWYSALLFVPFCIAGTLVAKKIVIKMPQKYFRRIVALMLGLAGLKFLLH